MNRMNNVLVVIGALALMAGDSAAYAGYASSSSGAAASSNGNGATYSSTGGYGPTFPYFPFPGFAAFGPAAYGAAPYGDNYASVINDYLSQIQAANYNGGSFTYAAPGAIATAGSYLGPQTNYQQAFAHHQALLNQAAQSNGAGFAGSYGGTGGGTYSGTGGNGVQFASATGSIGPGGYHQTASIYPASASSPNINNRFGGSSSSGPGGYQGVSTSSFSSSSDINGHKTGHREAVTSINDNGKVTTYKVHS